MLQETYKMINARLFDNELPDVYIYWIHEPYVPDFNFKIDGIHYALYTGKHVDHFIGIYYLLDTVKYFNAMVHEMIHVWQVENGLEPNHKQVFLNWCHKAYEEFYDV